MLAILPLYGHLPQSDAGERDGYQKVEKDIGKK